MYASQLLMSWKFGVHLSNEIIHYGLKKWFKFEWFFYMGRESTENVWNRGIVLNMHCSLLILTIFKNTYVFVWFKISILSWLWNIVLVPKIF